MNSVPPPHTQVRSKSINMQGKRKGILSSLTKEGRAYLKKHGEIPFTSGLEDGYCDRLSEEKK